MAYRYWELEKIIDGFSYQYAGPDEDAIIIIRENEWANSVGVRFRAPLKDLDSYIKYINERRLEEAIVRVSDLSFLEQCPTLKTLEIAPPIGFEGEYDYSPLYRLSCIRELRCSAYYGKREEYISQVDYSKINGLEAIGVQVTSGMKNFEKISTLKFLDKLKNLQIFGFDVNVEDGDLSPCLRLPTVWCYQGRRHYNLKNKDLPKQPYRGE